jgi:hypothetical protein
MEAKRAPRDEGADRAADPAEPGEEVERYGVLELRRLRKQDGRALLVFSRPSEDR